MVAYMLPLSISFLLFDLDSNFAGIYRTKLFTALLIAEGIKNQSQESIFQRGTAEHRLAAEGFRLRGIQRLD